MQLEFCIENEKLIVCLSGELDHHSSEEVRIKIDDRLDRNSINKLILDFSGVTFMDSSGIGVVIGRYKRVEAKKGAICLINVTESIKRIFEMSGIFKIIKQYESLEQAIKFL